MTVVKATWISQDTGEIVEKIYYADKPHNNPVPKELIGHHVTCELEAIPQASYIVQLVREAKASLITYASNYDSKFADSLLNSVESALRELRRYKKACDREREQNATIDEEEN